MGKELDLVTIVEGTVISVERENADFVRLELNNPDGERKVAFVHFSSKYPLDVLPLQQALKGVDVTDEDRCAYSHGQYYTSSVLTIKTSPLAGNVYSRSEVIDVDLMRKRTSRDDEKYSVLHR